MPVELIHLCLLYSRSNSTQGWKQQHKFKFFITFSPKCRIFIMVYLKYEMLKCFAK